MPVVAYRSDDSQVDRWVFFCPGCKCGHWFKTKGGHPEWKWNENAEKPTVSPSILVPIEGKRCHSYIRNGFIDFLNDCDHELRGKSVALPDISTW